MIDANTIKSLLKGVDVEWKNVTDIFNIKNGYTPSKTNPEFWTNGDIPWFRMEDIRENGRILNNSLQKINKIAIKGGKLFPANSIIISTTATIGEHALITVPYLSNQQLTNFSLKNEFKKILNIKFIYYYFFIFSENTKKIVNISSLPSVQMTELKKWNFPIPSLDVQNKIVNILDTFTALTTELTTELNARLKQYNYYRDKLLSFAEDEVEWKTLDEVFYLKNGYTPSKSEPKFWDNGNIPWFRMEDIRKNGMILNDSLQKINKVAIKGGKLFPANSIIIATSATIGEHALITVPYLSNQRFTNLNLKEEYKNKYDIRFVFYYCFKLSDWCKNNTTLSSFASVDMNGFKKFKFPILPLSKQKQIVEILDKFDTLTNSIAEGLPREIELRQKQYEYYRNLLLDFPKS